MAKGRSSNMIGAWAFLIGVILAVVLGLLGTVSSTVSTILVVIGLIVGLLNVADEETNPFLMSGAVLIIASAFGGSIISQDLPSVGRVLGALMLIFVPATIIVAVKNVFSLAKH